MRNFTLDLSRNPMKYNPDDVFHAAPLIVLVITGLVIMLYDAFGKRQQIPLLTGLGIGFSGMLAFPLQGSMTGQYSLHFNDMMAFGGVISLIHIFLCAAGVISIFFIDGYLLRKHDDDADAYSLVIFSIVGMSILASANDMIMVFIGLEIMSVCLYVMAGLFPRDRRSNEAGLKYLLLGAFAGAFMLYGIALLYGLSGTVGKEGFPTTRLDLLAGVTTELSQHPMFFVAVGLILIGFLFKVAAFPFHNWTPDVYTGTPTPLAGFMAGGSKLAAFAALSFFMLKISPENNDKIVVVLSLLAVVSMIYGNVVAVRQTNLKRMLAYSSIAHSGYLILGVCSGAYGHKAVLFYMFVYSLTTIGAFGVIAAVENREGDVDIENWKGFGIKYPWAGAAMSVFLFSLAGIPPLAGFVGKYFVFGAAVKAGLYLPAIVGILTSVVGAYYYLRVMVFMYFHKIEGQETPIQFFDGKLALTGAAVLTLALLFLGVFPSSVLSFLERLYGAAGFVAVK
jgi:NADH-quinone oxidoreductase subunit N